MAKGKYEYWLTPDSLLKLEGWARDGLTEEQIAGKMGIAYSTLKVWKNNYPAVLAAIKKGKEVVDRQVENALLKRALGYEFEEVREKFEYGQLSERIVTKKVIPPDTTAQIFWLKNRKPEEWRDRAITAKDKEEQAARIENIKANTARVKGDDPTEEKEDDGFLDALKGEAADAWAE